MLTEVQKNSFRQAVDKAVIWLDEVEPQWKEDINWDSFDLVNPFDCILGQLNRSMIGVPDDICLAFNPWAALDITCNNNKEASAELETLGNEVWRQKAFAMA
jgi:hypothetical protein